MTVVSALQDYRVNTDRTVDLALYEQKPQTAYLKASEKQNKAAKGLQQVRPHPYSRSHSYYLQLLYLWPAASCQCGAGHEARFTRTCSRCVTHFSSKGNLSRICLCLQLLIRRHALVRPIPWRQRLTHPTKRHREKIIQDNQYIKEMIKGLTVGDSLCTGFEYSPDC